MRNAIAAAALALLLSGCQYYKITDPNTGKVYFTHDWISGRYRSNGALIFKDMQTGKTVTLQNSEVEQIDKDEAAAQTGKWN